MRFSSILCSAVLALFCVHSPAGAEDNSDVTEVVVVSRTADSDSDDASPEAEDSEAAPEDAETADSEAVAEPAPPVEPAPAEPEMVAEAPPALEDVDGWAAEQEPTAPAPVVANERQNVLSITVPETVPAPALSLNAWPDRKNECRWLTEYYLPLPFGSPLGVYSDNEELRCAEVIFEQTNAMRAKKGMPLLRRDPHLDAVAQAHAVHMARESFFDHPSPLGMEVFERINCTDAPRWYSAGENIAAGQDTPELAMRDWMNSSGHKVNIRGESYEYIGIGAYYDEDSEYGWYWVQVFAGFRGDPQDHDWIEPGESSPDGSVVPAYAASQPHGDTHAAAPSGHVVAGGAFPPLAVTRRQQRPRQQPCTSG